MTRRQVSILIALVMVNYLLLNTFIRLIIESSKPAPTPTRTPGAVSIAAPPPAATPVAPLPTATPAEPTPTNTLVIKPTPNAIQPGQQLTIPAPGEVVPTFTPTPLPRPPTVQSVAPTATPTAEPTPTPLCAYKFCADPPGYGEINKGITQFKGHFRDVQGNPMDGYFAMLSCPGGYRVLSSPSGPWSQDTGKEPGSWEITLRAEPMNIDCTLQAVMYKCSEWFDAQCEAVEPLSEIVPVHTSAASGETIVVVDWICYDSCLPGVKS
jgi:hypothetical protein